MGQAFFESKNSVTNLVKYAGIPEFGEIFHFFESKNSVTNLVKYAGIPEFGEIFHFSLYRSCQIVLRWEF